MKRILVILNVLTVLAGGIWSWKHLHKSPPPFADARPETSETAPDQSGLTRETDASSPAIAPPAASETAPTAAAQQPRSPAAQPVLAAQQQLELLLDTLTDPRADYARKQHVWQQLRDHGRLDQAIAQLELRASDNPTNPAIPASLGQAYLFKASTVTNSIAQQGMCGMKADTMFDSALALDQNNWEARFWKATAMAHWPAVLDKSREVMQHFVTLIEQQESQPPQPQFAQSYVWLGKEYAKNGYDEYAEQVWKRGLTLFPGNTDLQTQLASSAQP